MSLYFSFRSITISQTSLGEYKDISTFQFTTSDKSLGSETDDCLCINGTKGLNGENRCFRSAVLDMNNCLGVPVFMSHPHLMWAEEDLKKAVIGLSPTESKHNIIIDFQPNLGYPVTGDIRLQFNMILRPTRYLDKEVETTKPLPRAVYPLLWVENNFRFTDSLIEEINIKLLNMLTLADAAQWTLIAIGGFIAIVALALMLFKTKK
ncbi:hypothetical protein FQR65_LT03494 [Abscondita terminalis]|nr:hypothetical protein FQR65_LT03494 [Abscondita terminalis]